MKIINKMNYLFKSLTLLGIAVTFVSSIELLLASKMSDLKKIHNNFNIHCNIFLVCVIKLCHVIERTKSFISNKSMNVFKSFKKAKQ